MELDDIIVYTLSGQKHLYKLGDMAYGQWIVFQHNVPKYYLDIFDDLYATIDELIKKDPYKFLETKFKLENSEYSLTQNIRGIWSSKVKTQWFDLEKLPIIFFDSAPNTPTV